MKKTELESSDFWDNSRYYLTNGIDFISKQEFRMLQKQNRKVYVISDDNNVFVLEFEVDA